MNNKSITVLKYLYKNTNISQRIIADKTGYSLGSINSIINDLIKNQYIDNKYLLTKKGINLINKYKPQNAVILAAGFGMRMVPINLEMPKGLLEVNNETLIERIIKQLHDVEIYDITIVVGFMKESYEFLIDKYNVKLVYNKFYYDRNNLFSLDLVLDKIYNTYIIPCDIWCRENPFNEYEFSSWYMITEKYDKDSLIKINKNFDIIKCHKCNSGNQMIGISYIGPDCFKQFIKNFNLIINKLNNEHLFWEEALFVENKMMLKARIVESEDYVEINTYENLRELDNNSNSLNNDAVMIIKDVLKKDFNDIKDIIPLKKGMTNRSFLFTCNKSKYIMRIPGEGTDKLIDRKNEYDVYNVIKKLDICDNIVYINPENGYKITEYIDNVRTCNLNDIDDLKKCMKVLKNFHNLNLKVNHKFDLFEQINFYESLWNGQKSIYRDYFDTKQNILSLKNYIEKNVEKFTLTHIDAVPDNFLIYKLNGIENVKLIDWEYAGMQDPHVDIAMFCIYSMYDREHIDRLIDIYFDNCCKENTKIKIYCYIAVCGLLWSNWCEYKRNLGVDFGEYSLMQYRYAKEYYKIAVSMITKGKN